MTDTGRVRSTGRLRLSSTSALVLLWSQQECYQSRRARDYLGRLDLTEAELLYQRCNEICPFYGEVIKNRKFGVLHLAGRYLAADPAHRQVVIPGAGLDALGIEITDRYPQARVFEVDQENMDLKSRLAPEPGGASGGAIEFVEADLKDSVGLYRNLVERCWNPALPTLSIFEGVSYYLPPGSVRHLVHVLRPAGVVFEFLKHNEEVAADRVGIPKGVFGSIAAMCGLRTITPYNYEQIDKLLAPLSVTDRYSMKRLENMRTAANRFFPTETSGWIEVCLLERGQ